MKRIRGFSLLEIMFIVVILAVIIFAPFSAQADDRDFRYRYKRELGGTSAGSVALIDATQTLTNKSIVPRTVWITDDSQLTQWSGTSVVSVSGQSIYQMAAGTLYMIDPYAILTGVSGIAPGGTTGFAAFSGVSLILPSAAGASTDEQLVGIGMGVSGETGYDHLKSGVTTIYVYPYAGSSSVTDYSNGVYTPETMLTYYSVNGTITGRDMISGTSYWEINMPGEIVWFKLDNDSQVSAYPVARQVFN